MQEMNERKMVKLKPIIEELKVVILIYNKYLEYKSLSKVETYCLQNNIKTKKGVDFNKANLRVILTNPVYVKATSEVLKHLENEGVTTCGSPNGQFGLLSYNKSRAITTENGKVARVSRDKSEWIAAVSSQKGVIEAADWVEVQKILFKNKNKFPNEGKTHNALLTGKLRCGKCGSNMQISHGHISRKTGKKIYYYACSLKKNSKGARCDNGNAKVIELDPTVKTYLKELALNKKILLTELYKQNKCSENFNNSTNRDEIIEKSIAEKEKQIQNLINKLAIDDISDLIVNKISCLKNEISDLKKELDNINISKNQFTETELNISFLNMLLNRCSIIDSLSHDEIKQFIDILFDKITWNGDTHELVIDFIGSNANEDEESKKI